MNKNPKISVIVPIYNVEKYLQQCIESIIRQTYTNLEIILVDDGSPDNCPAICDKYAKKDKRIIVIHKENGGVSSARNAALKIATGDILAFVDSDDWLELNAYELLVNFLIEEDLDCVFMDINFFKDGEIREPVYYSKTERYIREPKEIWENVLCDKLSSYFWSRIYRKECFDGIEFPEGRILEDVSIGYLPFEKATRKIGFIKAPLYNYRKNLNGIMFSNSPRQNLTRRYHAYLAFCDKMNYAKIKCPENIGILLAKTAEYGIRVILTENGGGDKYLKQNEIDEIYYFLKENKHEILKNQYLTNTSKLTFRLYYFSKFLCFNIWKIVKFIGKY